MSECHSCTVIGVQECADTILETLEQELQQAQEDGDLYQLHLDQLSCITDETRRADKLEHWVIDRGRNEASRRFHNHVKSPYCGLLVGSGL